MSLLCNKMSIAFLPRSKRLLILWLQSPSAVILEPKKIKSVTASIVFPSIHHEVMGPDALIFIFSILSFKPTFSLFSFIFIKRLFSSSLISAIRWCHLHHRRHLVAKPCPTLVTPWTVACQDPLSMEFSRQEYWSGLPFPPPGDLPDPGIEPRSPALQADDMHMQSTSCKMPGWINHKLESRFLGEISITSDTKMTPPLWQKAKN